MPTADYIEGGYTKLEWNLFRFLGSLSGHPTYGPDARSRCMGLCWQWVLAFGSETAPDTAHASCPSTHTRWFVGMFDSVRLVTGSPDGGRGCGTLARAIPIHSFIR